MKYLKYLLCFCVLAAPIFSCDSGMNSKKDSIHNNPSGSTDLNATSCFSNTLAAFPGAEGFGACASGGRGGRVLYVTNLADDPNGVLEGSFQWALNQEGPRYILFKVSGVINSTIVLSRGDVTIAGQTSPQGIIVRGFNIQGNTVCEADDCTLPTLYPQNFILRHLRSRVERNLEGGAFVDGDALRLHHAVNGIVDHFSAENAEDEAVQISYSRDITIQNSILAETIGGHFLYGGMLINYSDPPREFPLTRLSIHHNLWNRIVGRLPEISRDNLAANQSILEIELSSNLFWDPGYYMTVALHQPENEFALLYYRMNVVNNLFQARLRSVDALGDFTYGLMDSTFLQDLPAGSPTSHYFSGNKINLYPGREDYQLLYRDNDYPSTSLEAGGGLPYRDESHLPPGAQTSRHSFPGITYTATENLRNYMLEHAGAFPRDVMDQRLMSFVESSSFDPTPRNLNVRGDAFLIPNSTRGAPQDSDNDGMPDDWERRQGLDPGIANPNGMELSGNSANAIPGCVPGYTNLECYLNALP